jgi:hypothetical protein
VEIYLFLYQESNFPRHRMQGLQASCSLEIYRHLE